MNNVRYTGMTTVQAARNNEAHINELKDKIARAESVGATEYSPTVKEKKKRRFLFWKKK